MKQILITALYLGAVATLLAQSGGTITGTITDADGNAVPNLPVQVTNTETKAVFKATASAKGEYRLSQVPAGTYELSVTTSLFAFRPYSRKDVVVQPGQTLRLDIRLQDSVTLNTLGEDRASLAAALAKRPPPPEGPTPRLADGKPDLSGMWMPGGPPGGDASAPTQKPEWLPSAEAVAKQRIENNLLDIPSTRCLPSGITIAFGARKFVHTPALLVVLFEGDLPRQIYLDGRGHPKDPNPTWLGHSIGHWEGDTLVVDTLGFNDKTWLDMGAHPHTEMLHVIERFRRPDLGHLELEMTMEDQGVLKQPWTTKLAFVLNPKEEILESVCNENNRDVEHMVGK
jgi:hypothetical protein